MTRHGIRASSPVLLLLVGVLVLSVPLSAHAITRTTIIRRARVWASVKVPYSQTRYATEAGSAINTVTPVARTLGYRTDCSGFVSMSLGLKTKSGAPLSLDTAGLPTRLVKISKSKLTKGDVILRPKNLRIGGKQVAYGHAVVFSSWADSAKTTYWGLHESSSSHGAVRAKIRWGRSGFGSERGFAPYRYAGIRERPRVGRQF
jgi:hypothetical protein